MSHKTILLLAAASLLSAACAVNTPGPAVPAGATTPPMSTTTATSIAPAPSALPAGAPTVSAAPVAAPKPPVDAARLAALTGGKPETSENVVRVTFPRDDMKIDVDGWAKMPPFMGLTSWAAFVPGEKPGVEAMVMGDLVLFEDEVNAVMSAALDNGLEVTALHNHFFFDKPRVLFMHIGGEGTLEQLGKGL